MEELHAEGSSISNRASSFRAQDEVIAVIYKIRDHK